MSTRKNNNPDAVTPDHIIERNRRNAQHSTGPKTPLGKSRSCRNALKHGLTGKWLHSKDDGETFKSAYSDLQAHYEPQGTIEHDLLYGYAMAQHRWERNQSELSDLERLAVADVAAEHKKHHTIDTQLAIVGTEAPQLLQRVDLFHRYLRQSTRELFRFAEQFQLLQLRRKREEREAERWQIEKQKLETAKAPDIWPSAHHSISRMAQELKGIDSNQFRHFLVEDWKALKQREAAVMQKEAELGIPHPPPPQPPPPEPVERTPEGHVITRSSTRNEPNPIPYNHLLRTNPYVDNKPKDEPDQQA